MLVHIVNKRANDTLTLTREMFRKYSYNNDFDDLIMQSVAFDLPSQNGMIPMLLSLCKPDTDICDEFSVRVEKGRLKIEPFYPFEE